jgi:hypothetical protein
MESLNAPANKRTRRLAAMNEAALRPKDCSIYFVVKQTRGILHTDFFSRDGTFIETRKSLPSWNRDEFCEFCDDYARILSANFIPDV